MVVAVLLARPLLMLLLRMMTPWLLFTYEKLPIVVQLDARKKPGKEHKDDQSAIGSKLLMTQLSSC
jgi:hypothetical protein